MNEAENNSNVFNPGIKPEEENRNSKQYVDPFAEAQQPQQQAASVDKQKKNAKRIPLKDSFRIWGSICLATILLAMMTVLFWNIFRVNPRDDAAQSAKVTLLATLDNPDAVRIITVSKADSVFGRDYISDKEQMILNTEMSKVNERVMKLTNNLENFDTENDEVQELMKRQMTTAASVRNIMHSSMFQPKEKKFSGWKVKIEYEYNTGKSKIHSEFWAITDPTGKHVISFFEIPIV